MNRRGDAEITALVVLALACLIAAGVFVLVQAKMESQTYNKLTGAHTTWQDALWVELRVQGTSNP